MRERIQRIHEKIREQIGAAETALLPADVWLNAAEADAGLQVTPVAASDPLLSGAFAALDRDIDAIWYDAALPTARRAAIVAHEFGHFYLHPDLRADSCGEYDAPDSLFSQYAQVAVGYSPAERRESEANQFAAEFLLPSLALRHAFLTEKLTASEIASRVGVSESLILSRLSDAILNHKEHRETQRREGTGNRKQGRAPNTQPATPNTQHPTPLDASQKLAAEILTGPTLVDAGPGTGKTRTLIARLRFLIDKCKITSDNILALTFSNKAAGEMRERLGEAIGEAAAQVWIGTFHAFGLEFLRKEGGAIGLPPAPALLEEGDAVRLLEQNLDRLPLDVYLSLSNPTLPFPDILACISRAKDELQTPEDYRRAALALMETDREAGMKALEIAEIYAVYQQILAECGLLDFGDLLMRSVELLDAFPEVRDRWQAQYPHILADEYQDVNRASAELLRRLAGKGAGFWAVGDLRQAIYQFRGASPANIRDFERDFPGGKRLRLGVNYRSRPGIVSLFAASAATPAWETQRESNGMEPEIIFAEADDTDAQADGIAEELRRREGAGTPLREQAILCRTNRQASEMAEALEARNVPAQHLGNLFERREVKDLLALLDLCCKPHGATLRRVAQFPSYNIPLEDAEILVRAAFEAAAPFPKALALAADLPEISETGRNGLRKLWRDIAPLAYRGDSWVFLSRYLLETSDYLRPFLESETFAARQCLLAIRHLLAFTRNVCAKMRFVDGDAGQAEFLDYLRHLLSCGAERSIKIADDADDLDAVRLLTAHSSKGLEFPVVYLPNLVADQFPLRRQGSMASPPPFFAPNGQPMTEEPDTDENLFFVALSRARDALILSYPKIRNAKPAKISPLLKPLETALDSGPVCRLHWQAATPLAADRAVNGPCGRRLSKLSSANRPANGNAEKAQLLHSFGSESKLQENVSSLFPALSASALEEYQTCPRRFYYRRVLQIHTGPDDSEYLKFHDAAAKTTQWLAAENQAGNSPTESELQIKLAEVWNSAEEDTAVTRLLKRKAAQMLESLRQKPAPNGAKQAERKFTAKLPSGDVTVECDAATITEDGTLHLERHQKRCLKSDDHTERRLALLREAAKQTDAPKIEITLISLADGETKSVPEAPRYEPARVEKYDAALAAIRAGQFAPKPSDRECPNCPYFFVCPE